MSYRSKNVYVEMAKSGRQLNALFRIWNYILLIIVERSQNDGVAKCSTHWDMGKLCRWIEVILKSAIT